MHDEDEAYVLNTLILDLFKNTMLETQKIKE